MINKFLFLNTNIKPVVEEARANKCKLILVKDDGLYFIPEIGERNESGRYINIAFAEGFDPDKVDFDDWYDLLRASVGGDDFGEEVDATSPVFTEVIENQKDIFVTFTDTQFTIYAA